MDCASIQLFSNLLNIFSSLLICSFHRLAGPSTKRFLRSVRDQAPSLLLPLSAGRVSLELAIRSEWNCSCSFFRGWQNIRHLHLTPVNHRSAKPDRFLISSNFRFWRRAACEDSSTYSFRYGIRPACQSSCAFFQHIDQGRNPRLWHCRKITSATLDGMSFISAVFPVMISLFSKYFCPVTHSWDGEWREKEMAYYCIRFTLELFSKNTL